MTSAQVHKKTGARVGLWCVLVAGLGLAGCSSEDGDYLQLGLLRQSLVTSLGAGPAGAVPSRALVDQANMPLILARIETHGVTATIYPIERNGPVTTWTAIDKSTIALRDGQLVASRGLAPDLMSARVPTIAELRGGAPVTRNHYYLGHDDQTERMDFTCTARTEGAATIEILDLSYATEVIAEDCEGSSTRFTNTYWVQRDGLIRQSRQWVGPAVGFLELQRLDR